MARPILDLLGQTFGKYLVIQKLAKPRSSTLKGRSQVWLVKCDCGNQVEVSSTDLRRGRTTQCKDCYSKQRISEADPNAPIRILMNEYIDGAKSRRLEFLLNFDQFKLLTAQPCFFCREPYSLIRKSKGNQVSKLNGIDRIDSQQGYRWDNIVTACKKCNRAKTNMSLDEFLDWSEKLCAGLHS